MVKWIDVFLNRGMVSSEITVTELTDSGGYVNPNSTSLCGVKVDGLEEIENESCGGMDDRSERHTNNIVDENTRLHLENELWDSFQDVDDDDYCSHEDWLLNQEAQFTGQTLMPFVAKRVNRRKYKKGKRIHTMCRIAGAILHILDSAKGAKCYPTCKRIMSYTGFSESTVRRYLYDVLDYLARDEQLILEIDKVKGYVIYTQQWLDMVNQHGDELEPEKFVRSPWLKKSQKPFAEVLRKVIATPPFKNCPRTLRGDKSPFLKRNNLNKAGVPPAMMRLASSLLSKQPPPTTNNRFNPSKLVSKGLVAKVLSLGHLTDDVINAFHKAVRITDTAMADFQINNSITYCYGVMMEILPKTLPSLNDIKYKCKSFWVGELGKYNHLMKEGDLLDSPSYQTGLEYYQNKLKKYT